MNEQGINIADYNPFDYEAKHRPKTGNASQRVERPKSTAGSRAVYKSDSLTVMESRLRGRILTEARKEVWLTMDFVQNKFTV